VAVSKKSRTWLRSPEPNDRVAIYQVMKTTPTISEKKAAIFIWIGATLLRLVQ
jgi:hypothetical protein